MGVRLSWRGGGGDDDNFACRLPAVVGGLCLPGFGELKGLGQTLLGRTLLGRTLLGILEPLTRSRCWWLGCGAGMLVGGDPRDNGSGRALSRGLSKEHRRD